MYPAAAAAAHPADLALLHCRTTMIGCERRNL